MKVVISLKPLQSGSKTRGVGVYTRELIRTLQELYPQDEFIPTTHDYYHQDADLVHFPFFDPFFLTLPLHKSKPTIVTVHDLIPLKFPQHFPKGIRGTIKWWIQRYSLHQVDHLITDSISSQTDIHQLLHFPLEKISVIPLGPNIRYARVPIKLKQTVQQEYNLPDRYLLYVGDVNWNKNVLGLIKEFSLLNNPRLHLVLVGRAFLKEPPTKELRQIKALINKSEAKPRIHLLGFVPSHHLPALYALATLYIQPSWYEGFGLPILEAMEHRCPVISANTGSLPEVGGEAVVYFNPHKKGDLAEKIKQLSASAEKRRQLVELGKKQAKQFSWQKTAQMTYEVYQKLVH